MAHAYFIAAGKEEGIEAALAFAKREWKLGEDSPDVQVLRYGLFSAEDARRVLQSAALAPLSGESKLIIIALDRLFHETQNILLKSFEEPPAGTLFILVIPSEGVLIPTLRSRLVPLPARMQSTAPSTRAALEKEVERILAKAKKDDPEVKQEARAEALALVQGLMQSAYARAREEGSPAITAFLKDLDAFLPILHERAAPLKPILEHLVLTAPTRL